LVVRYLSISLCSEPSSSEKDFFFLLSPALLALPLPFALLSALAGDLTAFAGALLLAAERARCDREVDNASQIRAGQII
jgi:hypothetical protein